MTPVPEIRARHEAKAKPGYCDGGIPLKTTDGKCRHCGAGVSDTCGKWVREAGSDRAALLTHLDAMAGALKGMVGLMTLLCARPDVDPEFKKVTKANYRLITAIKVLKQFGYSP